MIIKHRVNTSAALIEVPTKYGVEIDLRLFQGELILAHDPFEAGEKFENWLENYRHDSIILNVKEDGLENLVTELLSKRGISKYFFLDQPFPTLRKSAKAGIPVAVRLSEYEPPINLRDLEVKWAWLDSFNGKWDYLDEYSEWFRRSEMNLCVVSPELQGRTNPDELQLILSKLEKIKQNPSAVCTKYPEEWERLLP